MEIWALASRRGPRTPVLVTCWKLSVRYSGSPSEGSILCCLPATVRCIPKPQRLQVLFLDVSC